MLKFDPMNFLKSKPKTVVTSLLVLFLALPLEAQKSGSTESLHTEPMQQFVDRAVNAALEKFADKKLAQNQLAMTLVDLTDPAKPAQASHRGNEQIYPASVVKLFYLAAAHRWMEDGKLNDTEELRRAMKDMIVDSSNEATGLVVDSLTGTTSGPELSQDELEKWYDKRNAVNRYFASRGYANINVNRKPWCEGPYGREMQSTQLHKPNHRNWLTTEATAQLMTSIATGQEVSKNRCDEMMKIMERDPFNTRTSPGGQARGYTGMALPRGSKLWSKAGWTSETRHDAAYVILPNGKKFALVIFTTGHSSNREIIATIAGSVVKDFSTE